jgi:hypothetical protein
VKVELDDRMELVRGHECAVTVLKVGHAVAGVVSHATTVPRRIASLRRKAAPEPTSTYSARIVTAGSTLAACRDDTNVAVTMSAANPAATSGMDHSADTAVGPIGKELPA